MDCNCKNIIPQSQECYDQMIRLKVPKGLDIRMNALGRESKTHVSIDPCIASEVAELWRLGIVTTGCCCGHNLKGFMSYIGVREDFIPIMKKIGYLVVSNNCGRPEAQDSFKPKSVIN